ncbi:MAG: cysteine peptidase family C39 domain-containing protein [Minicystis sp.]
MRRRVPVVRQMTDADCGAACLAMIVGYHGGPAGLAECRERLGTGIHGVSAQRLAEVARALGFSVRAFSVGGDLAGLGRLAMPAVAHLQSDHFVVLERWSPRGVDIVDPAAGRVRLDPAELAGAFSGVVLTLSPAAGFVRGARARGVSLGGFLRQLLALPGARGALARILAASVLLQALGLALPALTAILVDRALPLQLAGAIPVLAAGLAAVVAAQAAVGYARGAALLRLQMRLNRAFTEHLLARLLAQPLRFFEERSAGDLVARLGAGTALRESLTGPAVAVLLDGTLAAGALAILLACAPGFGLLTLAIGLAQVLALGLFAPRVRDLLRRDLAAQADTQRCLAEALGGVAALKAAGAEGEVRSRWAALFQRQLDLSAQRGEVSLRMDTLLAALRAAAPLALLAFGAARVLEGRMSLGTMLALHALACAFLGQLLPLVTTAQRVASAGAQLNRLDDVLSSTPSDNQGERS